MESREVRGFRPIKVGTCLSILVFEAILPKDGLRTLNETLLYLASKNPCKVPGTSYFVLTG